MFQIDLVHNAHGGWDDPEIIKRLLPPFQEAITLAVPFKFKVAVDGEGFPGSERVDLDRVVDNQIARDQRIHQRCSVRVSRHTDNGITHGGQVNNRGDTGEVLENDPAWGKRNLDLASLSTSPIEDVFDVMPSDRGTITLPSCRLKQNANGVREFIKTIAGQCRQIDVRAISELCGHGAPVRLRVIRHINLSMEVGKNMLRGSYGRSNLAKGRSSSGQLDKGRIMTLQGSSNPSRSRSQSSWRSEVCWVASKEMISIRLSSAS